MTPSDSLRILDRPEISQFLFYPRKVRSGQTPAGIREMRIDTADGHTLGCRLYLTGADRPEILFFHGNGEIANDYDDIGPGYNAYGLNFIVSDYRGYGISTGEPTVSAMIDDAHAVLDAIVQWRLRENRTGPLWLMGRSLGSAPAIELAAARSDEIAGLIIESGFAHTLSLLERLGIRPDAYGITEDKVFSNADKIGRYAGPVLVIHAEYDQIIPLDHGQALHDEAPGPEKALHIIAGADHNTIFMMAGKHYFDIIRQFIDQAASSS